MFNKDKKKVNEANTKYEEMEVAEEFGISVYASQKRLERIRKKLKKALSDQKN